MKTRHILNTDLTVLFAIISFIAISLYCINLYASEISIVAIILLIIGLTIGTLIPNILITWVAIVLTTIGSTFLLLGEVPVPLLTKLVLLVIFPISAALMALSRHIFVGLTWSESNRGNVERYSYHYDHVTKLQTGYNANKMYEKSLSFIKNDIDPNLWINITAVHWAHNTQFKQFHIDEYNQNLVQIAKTLKNDRLPSESLYYLKNGNFLIISHTLSNEVCERRNEFTRKHLNQIHLLQTMPQFKWGTLKLISLMLTHFQL